MKRLAMVVMVAAVLLVLAPLYVAAATNPDILAILNAGIDGLVRLVRDAYCASGVTALCK